MSSAAALITDWREYGSCVSRSARAASSRTRFCSASGKRPFGRVELGERDLARVSAAQAVELGELAVRGKALERRVPRRDQVSPFGANSAA